jgi:3-keto-disaccharide hydrolase
MTSDDRHAAEETLVAFTSGTLSDSKAAGVREHLRSCRTCRRRLSNLPNVANEPLSPDHETGRNAGLAAPGSPGSHNHLFLIAAGAIGAIAVCFFGFLVAWSAGAFQTKSPIGQTVAAKTEPPVPSRPAPDPVPVQQDKPSGQPPVPSAMKSTLADAGPAQTVKSPVQPTKSVDSDSKLAAKELPKVENAANATQAAPPPKQQAGAVGAPPVHVQPDPTKKASAPFFNGHDLTGWQGENDIWRVDQGSIVAAVPPGRDQSYLLCSQQPYRDFELTFQLTVTDGVGDCGVQFRSHLVDAASGEIAGPRCAIYGKDPSHGHSTGSLVIAPNRPEKTGPAKLVKRYVKPNTNYFRIRCQGKHVLIEVNRVKTVNADFPMLPEEGVIAWKTDAKRPPRIVRIKIIKFTDLSSQPSPPASNAPALADVELLKAELKFEKAMKHADDTLLNHFDLEIKKLKGSRATDHELTGAVEHEREAFKAKGLIPWSQPMRKWLLDYAKDLKAAQSIVGKAFDKALDRAEKIASDKEKEAIIEEAARVLAPRPVATWQWTGPRRTHRIVFFSDGSFVLNDHDDESNSKFWLPPYEDKIVVETPVKNDPSVADEQVYELMPDGTEMFSLRKNGEKIVWRHVEE